MRKFNPKKELNKIQHGNKNKIILSVCLLLLIVAIGSSYALYQIKYNKQIIYTTVDDFSNNKNLAIYVDDSKQDAFPDKSKYYFDKVVCDNNSTWEFDYEKWELTLTTNKEDKCNIYFTKNYRDKSGANAPELYQGLIPIYFDQGNIYIADIEKEWYDYDKHNWGNAVLIDNEDEQIRNKFYKEDGTLKANEKITEEDVLQMYVWIPRYKYELFNAVAGETAEEQMINIKFEKGVTSTGNVSCKYINEGNGTIREDCENAINGNWYTHPAFTFGETELPGIWVGKFRPNFTTTETTEEMIVLPNKSPNYSHRMKLYFDFAKKIETTPKYNLNKSEVDIHPLKNIDWGSVAYLTNSKYGRYINAETCVEGGCEVWFNNTTKGITGCSADPSAEGPNKYITTTVETCESTNQWNKNGVHASTTDNIYGIYDMHGAGEWARVMGIIVDESGKFLPGTSGFTTPPDSKYYDIYSFSGNFRGHLGDATREVYNPTTIEDKNYNTWYTSSGSYPGTSSAPWVIRGGASWYPDTSGIFSFGSNSGGVYNGWVVLTARDRVD